MRTRDVVRWHLSVRDALLLAQLALAGAALVMLVAATDRLERWMDEVA